MDRFDAAPKDYHFQKLLPETQSVIVFPARQIDGVVNYLPVSRSEYIMNFFISSWLPDTTAYKLAKFLEEEGYLSRQVSYAWSGEGFFPGVHKWDYGTFRAPLAKSLLCVEGNWRMDIMAVTQVLQVLGDKQPPFLLNP